MIFFIFLKAECITIFYAWILRLICCDFLAFFYHLNYIHSLGRKIINNSIKIFHVLRSLINSKLYFTLRSKVFLTSANFATEKEKIYISWLVVLWIIFCNTLARAVATERKVSLKGMYNGHQFHQFLLR